MIKYVVYTRGVNILPQLARQRPELLGHLRWLQAISCTIIMLIKPLFPVNKNNIYFLNYAC